MLTFVPFELRPLSMGDTMDGGSHAVEQKVGSARCYERILVEYVQRAA